MQNFIAPTIVKITVEHAEQTALDVLHSASNLPKQRLKDAMNKGAVWYTQKGKTLRLRRATKRLAKGVIVQLYYDATLLALSPPDAELLNDARSYSIWFKPHHMLSQGSQWGDHCSLLRWSEQHLTPQRPSFLVHRLDADAAGLMVIAHDQKTAAYFSRLFQNREIHKYYQAWIAGRPDFADSTITIDHALDDKQAISHVQLIRYDDEQERTLVKIKIDTGRKHQIRRHLADWGHPIIGDKLYGQAAQCPLQLLAYQLEFKSPTEQRLVTITLPYKQQFVGAELPDSQ